MAFRQYLLPDSNAVFFTIEVSDTNGYRTRFGYRVYLGEEMTAIPSLQAEADGEKVVESYDL